MLFALTIAKYAIHPRISSFNLCMQSAMVMLQLRFVILGFLSFSPSTASGAIRILKPSLAGYVEKLRNVHLHTLSTLLLNSLSFNFSSSCWNLCTLTITRMPTRLLRT